MPVKDSDNPSLYKGPRTPIVMSRICGFCNAKECNKCAHEIPYFEKLWICPCTCNKGWKPKDLGGELPEKKRRKKDEVRVLQLPDETGQPGEAGDAPGISVHGGSQDGSSSLEEQSDNSDS